MERAYINVNVPNIISVGIIAAVLYVAYIGLRKYVLKPKG